MKLRAPSVPLITVDPYFSVWSHDDVTGQATYHWTNASNAIVGTVTVDGTTYRFLGTGDEPALPQTRLDWDALSTTIEFENEQIRLTATFTSPLLITDLHYASRPVSYLKLHCQSTDGQNHTVTAKLSCSEELVLDKKGQSPVEACSVQVPGTCCVRMGNTVQNVLNRSGDNVRIDWGYLYLAARSRGSAGQEQLEDMTAIYVETPVAPEALFAFAYDDIHSIEYFGEHLNAYWKKDGKTIEIAIREAMAEYETLKNRCDAFAAQLRAEALAKGGEEYAQLTELAYRQVMAAHKLVVDTEGNNLYISKECFSNGCAATVDVTYPSAPMFLRYNTELLKAMLRPIFRYANTDAWTYDFAPHDVGRYPLLNGQVYRNNRLEGQMPIEECGNMIILMAAICDADNNVSFVKEHMPLLEMWKEYLVNFGEDPGNQLCTDDFGGHLSHNCNLSIKAIMGLAGYCRILERLDRKEEATQLMTVAKDYAASFCRRAGNPDGSYRLAFDQEGSFSLKYNAVWDKLWNTRLFPQEFYAGEMKRYHAEALPYGIPLDNRKTYTKSDWIHWICCMGSEEDFAAFNHQLWCALDHMNKRCPMPDWYYADEARHEMFQNRTVQGGLFMRYLFD